MMCNKKTASAKSFIEYLSDRLDSFAVYPEAWEYLTGKQASTYKMHFVTHSPGFVANEGYKYEVEGEPLTSTTQLTEGTVVTVVSRPAVVPESVSLESSQEELDAFLNAWVERVKKAA